MVSEQRKAYGFFSSTSFPVDDDWFLLGLIVEWKRVVGFLRIL